MKYILGAALLGLVAKATAVGEPYFEDSFDYDTSSLFLEKFNSIVREQLKTYYEVDPNTGRATSYGIEIPSNDILLANYPGPFSQIEPMGASIMAALPFDTNAPDAGVPINHVGFFYNPWGHHGGLNSPTEWLESHYDIHFHLWSPYVVNQIECSEDPNAFECDFNDANNAIFTPDTQGLPDNFFCANGVLLMGAHCVDVTNLASFNSTPSNILGSYQGQVNFLEPMVTLANIASIANSGETTGCYPWPTLKCHRKAGLYPTNLCINVDVDTVRVYFTDLAWHEADCDYKVFKGPINESLGVFAAANSVDRKKTCVIDYQETLDAGFLVVDDNSDEYCCRSQGFYKGSDDCLTGCDRSPLNNPFVWSGARCYYNCHAFA